MKELLNNPETIKNFKLLHYILLSNGLTRVSNDFYVDYDGNVDYHFSPWTNKGGAYDIIQTMGYESYYQEFEIDEKELLEDMVQWKEDGKLKIRVDFSGSGDSGYIDDVGLINDTDDKHYEFTAVWENKLYNILEQNHGGWEINEGSEGTFIINNENQTIELDFRMNVEQSSTGYEFKHQFEF